MQSRTKGKRRTARYGAAHLSTPSGLPPGDWPDALATRSVSVRMASAPNSRNNAGKSCFQLKVKARMATLKLQ